MGSIVIGIDPGLTGAVAVLVNGQLKDVYDMPIQGKGAPVRKRSSRTGLMAETQKKEVDAHALSQLIGYISQGNRDVIAVLEQVSPMVHKGADGGRVTEGSVSTFSLADSFGAARAILAAHIPIGNLHRVRPQVWKKQFDLLGKDKDAARLAAIEMYPNAIEGLARKKDIGRADAIMIATYGNVTFCNNGVPHESFSNHAA